MALTSLQKRYCVMAPHDRVLHSKHHAQNGVTTHSQWQPYILYINIAKYILVMDESAVTISLAILKEFKHCHDCLLTQLRNADVKLFPQCPNLLELIPEPTRHCDQSNDCVWDDKQ
jgi:hypothetical protein